MDPLFGLMSAKSVVKDSKKDLESRESIDVDVLEEERSALSSLGNVNDNSAIKIAKLHKSFGNKVAVHDVSLNIKFGETFGLIGPNGAGMYILLLII